MSLHIFTFLTDETRIKYLKESADLNNVEIHYIIKSTWNGYVDKIFGIMEVINKLPDTDIVCFIDGYDVIVNNSTENILEKFYSYNCKLLIGAELNCYPEIYKNKFPKNDIKLKYVNSGGYIGYVSSIKDVFYCKPTNEIIQICQNGGDQSYFIEYYLNNLNNQYIKLDNKSLIFQNMHWIDWNELCFIDGKVYNTILNSYPCFIHFNGGTWQQNNRENIMPIFLEKIKSKLNDDLKKYQQIITSTCYPHLQL